jgi:hypothetical protein
MLEEMELGDGICQPGSVNEIVVSQGGNSL